MITLSGDALAGDREYTVTLEATVLQDLTDDGLAGVDVGPQGRRRCRSRSPPPPPPARACPATVVVDPLDIGGEVGKKNTSDMSWDVVGTPVLTDDLA